jgi:hypothetical protein
MNQLRSLVVGIVICLVVPQGVRSQPAGLTPGVRVRLSAPDLGGRRLIGTLVRATHDTLMIEFVGRGEFFSIPTWRLSRLEVSSGRNVAAGAVRGAGIGFLTGVVLTTTLAALSTSSDCLRYLCLSLGTAYVAGAGVLVGAFFGALAPPEHWENVPLRVEPGRPTLPGSASELRFGLAISF